MSRSQSEPPTMHGDADQPAVGDAFGNMLLDCWSAGVERGTTYEVCERDDGHLFVHDAADYFIPLENMGRLDRWACSSTGPRVLDVGCGAGRHLKYLTEMGRSVLGIDASPGAVSVCTERGLAAEVVSITEAPEALSDRFNSILLFGNNAGLLGSEEAAPRILAGLAKLAAPGARLFAHSTDPYATSKRHHLDYHERNIARGRLAGQLRQRCRHRGVATSWFDYLMLSAAELEQLMTDSPWRVVDVKSDGPEYITEAVLA